MKKLFIILLIEIVVVFGVLSIVIKKKTAPIAEVVDWSTWQPEWWQMQYQDG